MTEPKRDYSRCKVLVPFHQWIEHDCELALRDTEKLGPEVIKKSGCSAIDFARSEMASDAVLNDWESILFVDSDMLFHPLDALRLFDRPEPVVGGLYSQKGYGRLCCNLPQSIQQIHVGQHAVDLPAYGIGAGFLRIRVDCLAYMIAALNLPCCDYHGGTIWPLFQPFTAKMGGKWAYLGEDYAFCQRCRFANVPLIVDPAIILYHIGRYLYGAEQAGQEKPVRPNELVLWHQAMPDVEEIMT